ncbi:MAG: 1-acyl-sn-glycerol-3-phosphate acyltransferase [Archangium sp.]|nr:1-acyl-sn-glycerol-3-phosphate acyltransferase [Archangium sp.]
MLRNLFCIFIAGVWTVILFPFAIGAMIVTLNPSASMYVVQRWWSPVLLWAGGAKLEVLGADKLKPGQPYIFVSNHQSTIDIPALFVAIPIDFRFVAKKVLKHVPFLGWYMSLAKFVFIDRANHRDALKSLEEAGARIRGGISIVMFPEGTRSDDRRVLPFKKGPFALALKAQVPLVPIAIEGSGVLMPKNSWDITPGPIKVSIGEPIDPAPFGEDRLALIKAVRAKVIEQNQALGGRGGNVDDAVAARGKEGTS